MPYIIEKMNNSKNWQLKKNQTQIHNFLSINILQMASMTWKMTVKASKIYPQYFLEQCLGKIILMSTPGGETISRFQNFKFLSADFDHILEKNAKGGKLFKEDTN